MAEESPLSISIVSDATGATAESVLTAVLVHLDVSDYDIRRFPFTRSRGDIRKIVREIARGRGIIVFTLVCPELREYLIDKADEKGLNTIDVMGPLQSTLTGKLHHAVSLAPGAVRLPEGEMYRVTEAINYTLLHDDGQGLDTLEEADLIILGVSRTGKTPTSVYLSCRKLKVANIPIIRHPAFPPDVAALARLPVKKVGFTMDADRLVRLRSQREQRYKSSSFPTYSSKRAVVEELTYAKRMFRELRTDEDIDVTDRSIEEISDWITHRVL